MSVIDDRSEVRNGLAACRMSARGDGFAALNRITARLHLAESVCEASDKAVQLAGEMWDTVTEDCCSSRLRADAQTALDDYEAALAAWKEARDGS